MRKSLSALALASALSAAAVTPLGGFNYGTAAGPSGSEWQDPQNLSFNKELPHAYFFPFASVENALKVLPENSEYFESLDGTWKFNWVKSPELRPADFYRTDFDVSDWDDIAVPGNWNVQGLQPDGSMKYGVPIYVNQPVIFQHELEVDDWKGGVMRPAPASWTVHEYPNEVGSYRRTFTVPEQWKDREVYINFDGVDSFFYLWINGQYVGFSKNSRNTAQFNITPYLAKQGENTVAVEVYRSSDGSFLEAQDMFRLPGIFRSTYLTSTPKVQIQDLQVLAGMDGKLDVTATVRNLSNKDAKKYSLLYRVYSVKLYSDEVEAQDPYSFDSVKFNVGKGDHTVCSLGVNYSNPRLWSAEEPWRYVLLAELLDAKGKTVEMVSTYFGFRTVEIRETPASEDEFGLAGRYYYVNGKPVKLKGVNRHENNLETGHHVSREQMEKEVMLMKRGNINHVRNSHYNDDPYWYIVADKYGIYLEDEANIESHEYYYGDASLSHPKEWRDAHVARNVEMVQAHFNHPSIVIWSLGNEAGPGHNFVEAYNAIKAIDTSRPVQYERNNDIVDMGSNQYPPIADTQRDVKGTNPGVKYPFHISEYAHSMGNAGGNLKDYWDAIESTNFYCGGAIWDWVDQAFWRGRPDGKRYMAYGGDFGDTPNDGMFCMNGVMFPDLSPKPLYAEVKRVYQNVGVKPVDMAVGKFEVFNKNYFTTLDQNYYVTWELVKDGTVVESGESVARPRMAVGPRESQVWSVPYDYASLDPAAEYFLNVQFRLVEDKPWAKKGYVQMEAQLPVKSPSAFSPISSDQKAANIAVVRNADFDLLEGPGFSVKFNNAIGAIESLTYGDETVIADGNGPKVDVFRAPTDNDVHFVGRPGTPGQWCTAGLFNMKQKAVSHDVITRPNGTVVVKYTVESQAPAVYAPKKTVTSGHYDMREVRPTTDSDFKITASQVYTIYPDGSIELQSIIDSNRPNMILPRLGYSLDVPSHYSNFTYYGRGPENNFRDRRAGSDMGLWNSTVADQFVHFPKPQSMGGREDVRWATLTDAKGNGLMFVALDTLSVSALPWNDNQMMLAPHPEDLPASTGTHVHLDTKTLGLGGASCGQSIALEPDRVYANGGTAGFIIRPVKAGADLRQLAKVSPAGDTPIGITRSKAGKVTVISANQGDTFEYYVVAPGQKAPRKPKALTYSEPIAMRDGGTITVWSVADPTSKTTVTFDPITEIPAEINYVSSEEKGAGEIAANLLDGDPSSIWHSVYGVTVANYPHRVEFDYVEPIEMKGFTWQHRQEGVNGDVKDFSVEVSNDGKNWTPVMTGAFTTDKRPQTNMFPAPVKARFLRLNLLSSHNGADFASGSEFQIVK